MTLVGYYSNTDLTDLIQATFTTKTISMKLHPETREFKTQKERHLNNTSNKYRYGDAIPQYNPSRGRMPCRRRIPHTC